MNNSTLEDELQQDLDEGSIKERIEKIEKKCEEEAKKKKTSLPTGFYLDATSLWYQPEPKGENDMPMRMRICSRLEVVAVTRNLNGEEFGRLLQWNDCDGRPHTWAMPMYLLAGEGTVYLGELLSKGLEIEPGKSVRQLLTTYIQSSHPEARFLCTSNVGWHDKCFVLPNQTMGQRNNEGIILQSIQGNGNFSAKGTLEEWQQIAKLSVGNSRLTMALSMSFASTLLTPLEIEGGGIHFHGISSLGKTTILRVAASVWGGKEYLLTWRATTNGLEGVALNHNDTLLCLDELGQGDPEKIGEAIYMLANGSRKARADMLGHFKPTSKWRVLFLSSGETNLSGHLIQAGKKPKAGQEVRVLDIPSDTGLFGAFENLHGHSDGESFVRNLNDLTSKFYGTASIRFIELFIANRVEYLTLIRDKMRQFEKMCLLNKVSGQVLRALNRFSIIAAAGELATAMGITGWNEGEAFKGVHSCFIAWLNARGGIGLIENEQIKAHIRRFFEVNGESRFVDFKSYKMDSKNEDFLHVPLQKVTNRAGFRECKRNSTTFYVFPEVFNTELCSGFEKKLVESVCIEENWLNPGTKRIQYKKRLPQIGSKWMYRFNNSVLGDEG